MVVGAGAKVVVHDIGYNDRSVCTATTTTRRVYYSTCKTVRTAEQ